MQQLHAPRIIAPVLEPSLFAALQLYVRALRAGGALTWEDWGRREIRHNDPFLVLLHRELTPLVADALGCPIKPSYAFLACYAAGGRVPPHTDREQCRYTLDLAVEASGPAWPLFVEGQPWQLEENAALLYRGCELVHHREKKPEASQVSLVFFHFVDQDFAGPLS